MFAQLSLLIPGFDLTPETIPSSIYPTYNFSQPFRSEAAD